MAIKYSFRIIEYSLHQMEELAKKVVERSVSIPGVQAKLLIGLVKEAMGKGLGLTEKQIIGVFNRIERNIPKAIGWIDQSFLSEYMINAYKKVIVERYNQLQIK